MKRDLDNTNVRGEIGEMKVDIYIYIDRETECMCVCMCVCVREMEHITYIYSTR